MSGEAQVMVYPEGRSVTFDAGTGLSALVDGVTLEIPPDAFLRGGNPVSGPVTRTVTPIDPSGPAIAAAPPLDRIESDDDLLRSVFMADLEARADGVELAVAPGAVLGLSFAVPAAARPPYPAGSEIAAWWFDVDAGYWVEEGRDARGGGEHAREPRGR